MFKNCMLAFMGVLVLFLAIEVLFGKESPKKPSLNDVIQQLQKMDERIEQVRYETHVIYQNVGEISELAAEYMPRITKGIEKMVNK